MKIAIYIILAIIIIAIGIKTYQYLQTEKTDNANSSTTGATDTEPQTKPLIEEIPDTNTDLQSK